MKPAIEFSFESESNNGRTLDVSVQISWYFVIATLIAVAVAMWVIA